MTITTVAETYLSLLIPGDSRTGMYVRLADKYGVPFGRIVNLTGLTPEVIIAHLEGGRDG